ncbi:scaffold protein CheW associated with MCPs of classes 40H and 40+24H [Citrifermentans bemidjiense Bem]|uniref:Scaffold protein CheW associated with MCPs of classes 40H and 40+24H n=1 Tax=Citrifermentans bemidjiense (strain ATCC BAA-1014 / DSM 16622 / JCM 12645 / Bem) TaxID=404380 RepID=B5EFC4_CITBB|nr:chemotaxis protein CheW [Citrifermentans bemidjiense]ACH40879.1 scaffold protein CheW associated with MCPs of classes 40H and 40+24H [Citrifermentans bemidjiense Bem]
METTSSVADIQMVTFLLGSEEYGVDVMDVREIVDITDVTKVANAPSHVEGVIDLRGSIVPIVSLKKRFGLPEAAAGDYNCIAVMDFAGALTGFVIDEVTDVIRVARRDILPPLELGSEPWMEGILSLGPRLIVVMNLKHLA